MTNKINRRLFFSNLLDDIKKPFTDSGYSYIYQGISLNIAKNNHNKSNVLFMDSNILEHTSINKLTTVRFQEWPHKKTDIFFINILKKENITPLNRYALTTKLPEKSLNTWDKIVLISAKMPHKLPKTHCPVLIIQDIENFDPTTTPADLLPDMPSKSDIFIAQNLDLTDSNNPATKRIYDFLGE